MYILIKLEMNYNYIFFVHTYKNIKTDNLCKHGSKDVTTKIYRIYFYH